MLYVIYEFIILMGSIIGPSTILLLLVDTYQFIFGADLYTSYFFALAPTIIFIIFCSFAKSETQILVATIFSSIFGIIMIAVLVTTFTRVTSSTLINPSTAILLLLFLVYITAAMLHPREFKCIVPGFLYFLLLPSTFVFLQIYALFNLNNVSWGTREIKPIEEENEDKNFLEKIFKRKKLASKKTDVVVTKRLSKEIEEYIDENKIEGKQWLDHSLLADSELKKIDDREAKFFDCLIEKYLTPIVPDYQHKIKITNDLRQLRNNCSFSFCMINAFWVALIFNLQVIQSRFYKMFLIELPITYEGEYLRYEPLSFLTVALFFVITVLQYLAMLWHRFKTLLHLTYTAAIPKELIKRKHKILENSKHITIMNSAVDMMTNNNGTSMNI
jgi:hypothetical protein